MESHLETIASAVKDVQKPPVFVSGSWNVPKDVLKLFYVGGNGPQYIPDFAFLWSVVDLLRYTRIIQFPATEEDCKSLSVACQAATFGVDNKDVLDESYRKAGKMDRSQFSISFDGDMSVSIEHAAKQLLQPSNEGIVDDVVVELYKLNVYGMRAFSISFLLRAYEAFRRAWIFLQIS